VPGGVAAVVDITRAELPDPLPIPIASGLNVQFAPEGNPPQDKLTVSLKPLMGVMVTVVFALCPAVMVVTTDLGRLRLKSVTCTVAEAELVPSAFEIAVTVSGVAGTADGAVYKPPGVMIPLLACHVTVVSAAF